MYSFPVDAGEDIVKKGLANLASIGETLSGALYLTTDRLVFVGYFLDMTRKYMEDMPLAHISQMTIGKSLFIIPNVLNVCTIEDKKLKFVVSGTNEWLTQINEQKQASSASRAM